MVRSMVSASTSQERARAYNRRMIEHMRETEPCSRTNHRMASSVSRFASFPSSLFQRMAMALEDAFTRVAKVVYLMYKRKPGGPGDEVKRVAERLARFANDLAGAGVVYHAECVRDDGGYCLTLANSNGDRHSYWFDAEADELPVLNMIYEDVYCGRGSA